MKKDFERGEGCNCEVMGDGNNPADHAHVSRATPLDTKRKELEGPQYQEGAISKSREKRTSAQRRDKDIRPI